MADHKYIRKYMGKHGKMIYVYKDANGNETTLNPDEEGEGESGDLTSKQAQATLSNEERRKAKFAAFYQKAVATGKEAVETSQEESKKKSSGGGSSKKAAEPKQQAGVSASSSGDATVDSFAQQVMSKKILLEDIPPQYQAKVEAFVNFMNAMGVSMPGETSASSTDVPVSDGKHETPSPSSGSKPASSGSSSSANAGSTEIKHAPNSIRPGLESTDEFERPPTINSGSSTSKAAQLADAKNEFEVTTTAKKKVADTPLSNTPSGGVSGGGAGRSGHADTTVKMSDVKPNSPAVTKAVDWVKKLFGK